MQSAHGLHPFFLYLLIYNSPYSYYFFICGGSVFYTRCRCTCMYNPAAAQINCYMSGITNNISWFCFRIGDPSPGASLCRGSTWNGIPECLLNRICKAGAVRAVR